MVMDNRKDYNQIPDDRLLLKLSRLIGDWWPLAKLLGVSDAAIERIEVQDRDPQRRCYNVLTKWRKDNHAKPTGSVQYLHEQCQEAEIDPQTIEDVFGCPLKEEKESVDRKIAALEAKFEDLKRLCRYLLPPDHEESSRTSTNRLTCSHTNVYNLPMNRCNEVSSPKCHLSNQNIPESINGAQFPQDRRNQHCEIPCMNPTNTKLIVAAIDIGTTYSGWAFSFRHDYYRDPTKIRMRQWHGGQIVSCKAPTTVLIQPDGKTLEAFGYEAEDKYAFQENRSEWYFFRRFKMLLHGKMDTAQKLGTPRQGTPKRSPAGSKKSSCKSGTGPPSSGKEGRVTPAKISPAPKQAPKGKGKAKKEPKPPETPAAGGDDDGKPPEGCIPIFLSSKTQEIFHCHADVDVTQDNQMKIITKQEILDDLHNCGGVSDFHPFKQQIINYPSDELLLMYDFDFRYGQNFYIALTEKAKEKILNTFDRHVHLEDETKKLLPAKTVFSLVIKFLREEVLKEIVRGTATVQNEKDDVSWVLTVPAIWNDAAKQFMREAAVEAGIRNENLKIALEPEAASMYCRLLPVKQIDGIEMAFFKTGSKYLVLDAGGGTVDITVYEVIPDGNLRELHKASGGAWGSTNVDVAFEEFIISIVGKVVFQRFQSECKEDYIDLLRAFEIRKRDVAPDNNRKYTFSLPSSLIDIFEDETDNDLRYVITQSRYAGKLVLARGRLLVDASLMQGLFTKTIQNIVSHLKEMMKDSNILGISNILMVGGFSESKMLQSAIKFNFPGFRIVVPCEPELMVLKGAVVFGHSPLAVAERVYKYTYGVKTIVKFDAKIHDECKLRTDTDELVCDDIFSKHVEIGQTISLNETTEELCYVPLYEEQIQAVIDIYASTQKSPMYVTDEGCLKVGSVIVDIQDNSVPSHERFIHVSLRYGGTKLEVKVREERTGKTLKATLNFLG